LAFCLAFVLLYRPLDLHQAGSLTYEVTMAIYFSILSIPIFLIIKLVKLIPYFSNPEEWTIIKEISAIAIVLLGMGITVYFLGFLMEEPGDRWNLATFLDSVGHAFLLGMVPFLFFTATNYRHLFATELVRNFNHYPLSPSSEEPESLIKIASRLKKEDLSIDPDQFVYAESEGNYVVFYLLVNNQIHKKIIRNSINNIAEQLSIVPYFIRTHRGFIVNVKQVISQKGNTLGYRLKINGVEEIIPVSRQNTHEFDHLMKQYS
jgi:DNA-binding LytR/AlgR family response regulator